METELKFRWHIPCAFMPRGECTSVVLKESSLRVGACSASPVVRTHVGGSGPPGQGWVGAPGTRRSRVCRVSPQAPSGQSVPPHLCHSHAPSAPEEPGHLGEPCFGCRASAARSACALEPAPSCSLVSGRLHRCGSRPTGSTPPLPAFGAKGPGGSLRLSIWRAP